MARYGTKTADSLIRHQQRLKKSLADFESGRNTAHLSADEIDQVIQGLNERLTVINDSLAGIA